MGLNDWLRSRALRWLAGADSGRDSRGGGEGLSLTVEGARFVSVQHSGQVEVHGAYVVARGCQVVQDSTGEKISSEAERNPEAITDEISLEVKKPIKRVRTRKPAQRKAHANWQEHNMGSGGGDEI